MAKKVQKSSRGKSPKLLLLILLLVGAVWGIYRFYPREQANIFVISSPLQYGNTSVTGTLLKDTPAGEEGAYYLLTQDGTSILLKADDIDTMIGLTVTAKGYLMAPVSETGLPYMLVEEMGSN